MATASYSSPSALEAAAVRRRARRRPVAELRDTARLALRFAQQHRPITFDDQARERWIDIYPQLSSARPGLAGAATARAEAHTVRLALIYALLDLLRAHPPRAPPSGTRGLALQRRLRPLDLRRRARRPHRRRDLGSGQGTPRPADPHRGLRHVQPQQETPRDRARPLRPRRRRTTTPRNPPTTTWPIRRALDPGAHPRHLTPDEFVRFFRTSSTRQRSPGTRPTSITCERRQSPATTARSQTTCT